MKYTFSIPKLSTEFKSGIRKIIRVGLFLPFSNWTLCILSQQLHKENAVKMSFGPKTKIFSDLSSLKMPSLGFYLLSNNIFHGVEINDKIAILALFSCT